MKEYIYALRDPRTHQVYYIGRTSDLNQRLIQHLNTIPFHNMSLFAWIKDLTENDLTPTMECLETIPSEQASKTEIGYIREYFLSGHPLTNQKGIPLRGWGKNKAVMGFHHTLSSGRKIYIRRLFYKDNPPKLINCLNE